jgi:O-antigen ligase
MGSYTGSEERTGVSLSPAQAGSRPAEPRWDLAFVGILGYLVVEYTRLPAMYPVLQPLNLGKVVLVVSLLGLLLGRRTKSGNRSIVYAIDFALCLFVLGSFLSTCFAPYQDPAWDGFVQTLIWVLIYILIGRIVNSPWRLRIFVFVFLALNLKIAQFGIRTFYQERAAYDEMVAVVHGAGAGSQGFFSNSADFGVAMCVAWAIATTLLFAKAKPIWRLALLMVSGITLFSIFVCGSRGAVVGAACIALAAWVKSPKKRLAAVIMAVLMVVGILFVLPQASLERFRSAEKPNEDSTAHQRLMLWKEGLMMFRDHPLLGVGLWNYPPIRLAKYVDPMDTNTHESVPHSLYIQAIAELGLGGTLPLIAIWIFLLVLNARTRRHLLACDKENRRSFEYCLAIGLDLAFVGYMSSGAFVAVLYYPELWLLLGLSVGSYTAAARKQPVRAESEAEDSQPELVLATSLQGGR